MIRKYKFLNRTRILIAEAFLALGTWAGAEITKNPEDMIVPPGVPAGFAVSVNGLAEPTFQWFHDEEPVPGETSDIFIIHRASEWDAGEYWVRVSSATGILESERASLEVIPEELPATVTADLKSKINSPSFFGQPLSTSLPNGGWLWASTQLFRINPDGSDDENFNRPDLNLDSGAIRAMAADTAGNVLIYGTRGNGINFVSLVRPGSSTTEPLSFEIHSETPNPWPRAILSIGENDWLIASARHLDRYREGLLINSWSFDSITLDQPLQRDENGQVWIGANGRLFKFSPDIGPSEHLGPGNFRLIPGGGFFGITTETEGAGGSVLLITETVSRYTENGELDASFSPFGFERLSYYGKGIQQLLPQSDGSTWVTYSPILSATVAIADSGEPAQVATVNRGANNYINRKGLMRLDPNGKIDLKRSLTMSLLESSIHIVGQTPDTNELIISSGSVFQRINPNGVGALNPPRVLRAIPRRDSIVRGEPLLVDAVIVGKGEIESGSLREESPIQVVRTYPPLPYRDEAPHLRVSNSGGAHGVELPVNVLDSAPQFWSKQDSMRVDAGRSFTLPVQVIGTPPFTYRIVKDGVETLPAADRLPEFPVADDSDTGEYLIQVTNRLGSAEHILSVQVTRASRLSNLSVRAYVDDGEALLVLGHVIKGGTHKRTFRRAVGPTLQSAYGVSNALADPTMEFRNEDGILLGRVSQNNDFGNVIKNLELRDLGAFNTHYSNEPASFLGPEMGRSGINTLMVKPENNEPGIALAEIYDADNTSTRLINLSARALAGHGEQAIMAGFVISGQKPMPVLIRAIGPTLSQFGLRNPANDPLLKLIKPDTGEVLHENDDWEDNADVISTTRQVGAFPLPPDSNDAVLNLILEPGVYVAEVTNKTENLAIALIEVYDASP